jgi:hypothetical protein
MRGRQVVPKEAPLRARQSGDDLSCVEIVLGSGALALEEELKFGSQVRQSVGTQPDGLRPWSVNRRVTAVHPLGVGPRTHGQVEAPRLGTRTPDPDVVLAGGQITTTPPGQGTSGSDPHLPTVEPIEYEACLVADYSDIGVFVRAPPATDMELQSPPAADPPSAGRCFEDREDGRKPHRLPSIDRRMRAAGHATTVPIGGPASGG